MNNRLETNNAIITLKALKDYTMEIIEKENLTDTCIDVKGDESCDEVMIFNFYERNIKINYSRCLRIIRETYMDMNYCCDSFLSKIDFANKWNSLEYRTNITNLFLMCYINHEIQHIRQFNAMKNMTTDNMNQLLLLSYALHRLDLDQNDGEYYQQCHDKFLFEYQANAVSGYNTIQQFTNNHQNIVGDKELELFNMFVAAKLLDGYTGINNDLNDRTFPIQFLKDLSTLLNYYKDPLIEVLKAKEVSTNNIDDLLNGRKISDDMLNEISDIAFGKVKTLNLYDSLYSIRKNK